jgi:hypothetical protein
MHNYYSKIINTSNLGLGSLVISIKKDPNFLSYINEITSFLENDSDLPFRLYHIRNNLSSQVVCKNCGIKLKKIRISFCNKTCSALYNNSNVSIKNKKSKSLILAHSKKTKEEKNEISNKRKNTNIQRYGVSNNLHIPEVNEKIVKTWISKYGCDRPSKNKKIKEIISKKAKKNSAETVRKSKITSLKKYGEDNIMKTDIGKQKVISTNIKKYGFPSPMQNPEFCKNYFNNHYKKFSSKNFILPSGRIIKLLGFEPQVLTKLLEKFEESDILFGYEIYEKLKCTYTNYGKIHKYIPDFYIKSKNLVIEVKSKYTYSFAEPKKRYSVKNTGALFIYAIYENNKIKLKRYENSKN